LICFYQNRGVVKDKRPVHLNLLTMRFPCTAVASIAHRASGVLIFLFIPGMIYLLQQSLASDTSFAGMMAWMRTPMVKAMVLLLLAGLTYHILAGIRHLVADCEIGESLCAAKVSAYAVFLLTAVLVALEACWLW
jgi:succinate dehydrogenase / fumarate reductase, cytochrome b subunit